MTPESETKLCDEDYFLDHGTKDCESCAEICDMPMAKVMGTEEQCWSQCEPYARMHWPEVGGGTPRMPVDGNTASPDNTDLPQTNIEVYMLVGFACIVITVIIMLSVVLVCKRRGRNKHRPAPSPNYQTATLLPGSSVEEGEAERSVGIAGSRADEDVPLSVSIVEEGSRFGQEEGDSTRGQQAAGDHDWHILPSSQKASPVDTKRPVQVSVEGNRATYVVAPSVSCGNSGEAEDLDSGYEYHSTEPKTVEPPSGAYRSC